MGDLVWLISQVTPPAPMRAAAAAPQAKPATEVTTYVATARKSQLR